MHGKAAFLEESTRTSRGVRLVITVQEISNHKPSEISEKTNARGTIATR
jgi:hypothetical protein